MLILSQSKLYYSGSFMLFHLLSKDGGRKYKKIPGIKYLTCYVQEG
jgi:hypothetical protein